MVANTGAEAQCAAGFSAIEKSELTLDNKLRPWEMVSGACEIVFFGVRHGDAALQPATRRVLHARGRVWRYLGWQAIGEDGSPHVWPLNAGTEVLPWP